LHNGQSIFRNDMRVLVELERKVRDLEGTIKRCSMGIGETHAARYSLDDILGKSERLNHAKEVAGRISQSEIPILISGESGTGKELFAHAIHTSSHRRDHPFVRVDCASTTLDMLESDLFGQGEGCPNAVKRGRPGKFELARDGTIFLDEVGALSLYLQRKLLFVLKNRQVERLDSQQPRAVDCRLIAATKRNLEGRVKEGYFNRDLLNRLNIVSIPLPSLREIKEDIPLLTIHFLKNYSAPYDAPEMPPEIMKCFLAYDWPGNTRELRNVVERATFLCQGYKITLEHLPVPIREFSSASSRPSHKEDPLHRAVPDANRRQLLDALLMSGGNRTRAATILKIHRTTLYYRLKKYGIKPGIV